MQWSKEFTGRLLPGACNARTRGVVRPEPAHEIDILKADFLACSYHVAQFVYQVYRGSQVHRRRVGITQDVALAVETNRAVGQVLAQVQRLRLRR